MAERRVREATARTRTPCGERRAAGPRTDTPAPFPLAGRRGIRLRPVPIACDSAVRHSNDRRFRRALLGQRRQAVEGDGARRSRWGTDDARPDRSFAGFGNHSIEPRRSSRSDDGAGIPSDNLGKVFDPLVMTRRDQGSTGLLIRLRPCRGEPTGAQRDRQYGRWRTTVTLGLPMALTRTDPHPQEIPAGPAGHRSRIPANRKPVDRRHVLGSMGPA